MAGHITIGSTHGNSIGLHDSLLHAIIDLSIVDKYLVATNSVVENYVRLKQKYLKGINNPEIISINSEYYRNLATKHKSLETKSQIKNIMVIEYPLTETRHNIYSFWPYQLELMIRVGKFLSKQGLHTILKRHPDRLQESEGLYEEYYSENIKEPFETVFNKADAYMFMNISSTTFGFALTTNRPIFIFSTWLEDIWDEMVTVIKKRCIIIPSKIDSNGLLQFDKKFFLERIKSKEIWNIDYEIVNKFMIP